MPEVTAAKVADYLIHFAHKHGDLVTNLKLQKLLYYAQAWHLALYDRPLFDARLEAWVHGPVQPTIYHKYKVYGWNPISDDPGEVDLPADVRTHLDEVMAEYGGKGAYELERLTHQELPWQKARKGIDIDEPSTEPISQEDMKQFYRAMADGADSNA